jgi:hypothetical protein
MVLKVKRRMFSVSGQGLSIVVAVYKGRVERISACHVDAFVSGVKKPESNASEK